MSVERDRGRWRYRTTAYYADGTSVRITGSAPPYDDNRDRAIAMEAEHVQRVRTLQRGQEDASTHTSPTGAPTDSAEPAKPLVPTVAEFHSVYLESERIAGLKSSTMKSKETIFRTHIVPRLGALRLDEVTYAVIEDLKLALAKTQAANTKHKVRLLGPKTIHNVLVCISDMLGAARKRSHIAAMPEIDWIKIPEPEFDFLTFEEAPRLLAATEPAWRTLILVALRTGMRLGELLGLRWIDVDLSAGRITVRQAIVDGVVGLPKSNKSREIPLGQDVVEALGAYRHDRGPLVFCDAAGRPWTAGKLAWPLLRACRAAKLGREIGWHVLRHTFASHLVMRGVSMKAIQELLGHASIITTMRYAHLAPHVAREAVRLLDAPPPIRSGADPAPTAAIVVEVAKDWPNSPPDPITN